MLLHHRLLVPLISLLVLCGCGGDSVPSADAIRKSVADAGKVVEKGAQEVGTAIQKGAGEAGAAIQDAVEDVPVPEELREVYDKIAPVLSDLTNLLDSINDKEEADDALAKISDISEKIDFIKPFVDKLPKPARAALKPLIGGRIGRIKDKVDKILQVKEVADTLRPALTALVKKLQGLTD